MTGLHLLVQGFLSRPLSPEEARAFLFGLADLLRVQPISGPHVFQNCAILIIAESHLSLHWQVPISGQARDDGVACWVDAFSCREFDTARADGWIKTALPFLAVMPSYVLTRSPIDGPAITTVMFPWKHGGFEC